MRLTRAFAAVGVFFWLVGACAANSRNARPPPTYVVKAQDTLFSIAWRHHLDYRELAKWNHLGGDYRVAIGQVLVLHASASVPQKSPRTVSAADRAVKWSWPTEHRSPPRPVPGGGILLLGRVGQEVRAAGAGRVVYTGSGLRGYGNLVIIKHGNSLLSSYAHNRELLVHEGQEVAAGQMIGHMGTGAHQIAALYFEIRVNGRPADPLRYLPKSR